jgi:hypothetical protein
MIEKLTKIFFDRVKSKFVNSNIIAFISDLSILYSISNTKRIIYTWSDTNADYIIKKNWLHVH